MQKLAMNTLWALLIAGLLAVVCYFVVDREVANFIHGQQLNRYLGFKYLTFIPEVLVYLIPVVIVYLLIFYCKRPLLPFEQMLLRICLAVPLAGVMTRTLKFVFGRYWPLTWTDNNPSWIDTHAYGFHFFHLGTWYNSFPSGHTTTIFTAMVIVWLTYPRWRWLCVLLCAAVVIGLLGMNYHFIGDIIAGAFLGAIVGKWFHSIFPQRSCAL